MPPDDLPGLDDDESPETDVPAAESPANELPGNEPPPSTETAPPQWSGAELDDWFENSFKSAVLDQMLAEIDSSEFWEEFTPALDAWNALHEHYQDGGIATFAHAVAGTRPAWPRLSAEMKELFRRAYEAGEERINNSVVGDLAPLPLTGPVPKSAAPAVPVPHAEETSPAPGRFNWKWFAAPVVGAVLVGLFVLMGGSDEDPPASVGAGTSQTGTEVAVDEPSEDVDPTAEATTASTATTVPAALFPPEDYGPCHIHPEEDATTCRPHYDLGFSSTSMNRFGDSGVTWETTQTFVGAVPVNPEFPIQYRLVIESTNGQRIEHLLAGGPGAPLTCVRRVNGEEAPLAEGEICGEFTAPDSLDMLIDVSTFAPGVVSWVFSTLETEPDGTRHGDWVAGGGNENFQLSE